MLGGIAITSTNVRSKYPDDQLLKLGTDNDIVLLNRSATLTANTALANVLEGTPVTPALAANSLIISNITDDGDILIAASDGGNSKAGIWIDGSRPGTYIYNGVLGDTLDADTKQITNVNGLTLVSTKAISCANNEWCGIAAGVINSADDAYFEFFGINFGSSQGSVRIKAGNHAAGDINFYTGANTLRLGITYAGVAAWASGVTHTGLTLGGAFEGAAQNLNDVAQLEISKTDGIPIGTIKTAKVTKAHGSDLFDAVALTDSVVIWQQPANSILLAVKMRLETQFAATSMTDLDVTIGLAGDPDGLVETTTNLTSDSADTEYHTRGAYWDETAALGVLFKDAATDWVAYATAVGANLDTTTAGSIDFYFVYLEL